MTSMCSASYIGCQRDAARISCWEPVARRPQLKINIFCPQSAQQQTRQPPVPLLLSIDGTDRQTDRRTDTRPITKRAASIIDSLWSKSKGSPYSITERRVPELIPVLGSQLPKTVRPTRQHRGCDLNPGPSAPESSTLTTRLPRATPIQSSTVDRDWSNETQMRKLISRC